MLAMVVKKIVGCARCGLDHINVQMHELTRAFAPPEAAPVKWTHWAPCPTNKQPIMFVVDGEIADTVDGLPD